MKESVRREEGDSNTSDVSPESHTADGSNASIIDRLEDPDTCRFCGDDAVVVVKNRNLSEKPHKTGNPYRKVCVSCGKHISMASEDEWKTASDRFIVPKDETYKVAVFDCPSCDELVEGQPDECPNCGVNYVW